jgi:hypothetical protein
MSTSSIDRHLCSAAQAQYRPGAACWLARLHRRVPPQHLLAGSTVGWRSDRRTQRPGTRRSRFGSPRPVPALRYLLPPPPGSIRHKTNRNFATGA